MKKSISFLSFALAIGATAQAAPLANISDGNTLIIVAHDDDQALFFDPVQVGAPYYTPSRCTVVMSADGGSRKSAALANVYDPYGYTRINGNISMSDTSWWTQGNVAKGFRDNSILRTDKLYNAVSAAWAEAHNTASGHAGVNCNNVTRIVTHNPWGEYGHPNHIKVFNAVEAFGKANGIDVYVDTTVKALDNTDKLYNNNTMGLQLSLVNGNSWFYGGAGFYTTGLFNNQRAGYNRTILGYYSVGVTEANGVFVANTLRNDHNSWTWHLGDEHPINQLTGIATGTNYGNQAQGFVQVVNGNTSYYSPSMATGAMQLIRDRSGKAAQLYYTHKNLYSSLPFSSYVGSCGTYANRSANHCPRPDGTINGQTVKYTVPHQWSFANEEKVQHIINMYAVAFNLTPEVSGVAYWSNRLMNGDSLEVVTGDMMATQPALAIYPSTMSNTDFVKQVYRTAFMREADASGLAYWESTFNTLLNQLPKYQARAKLVLTIIDAGLTAPYDADGFQTVVDKLSLADAAFSIQLDARKDKQLSFNDYPTRYTPAQDSQSPGCTNYGSTYPDTSECSGSGRAGTLPSKFVQSLNAAMAAVAN